MNTRLTRTSTHGLEAIELLAPDGSRATVLLYGAQLLSWVPAGAQEQLYLSPRAVYAPGQAIRGGVPVVFPQFSGRGPLMQHGFARNKTWHLVAAEQDKDGAIAVLQLTDDASTRLLWPHRFALKLSVRIRDKSLEISLACENKGDEAFAFTSALHTYFRVEDLAQTSLLGLDGLSYWDAVENVWKTQLSDVLLPKGPLDRIYHEVKHGILLSEMCGESERKVRIGQQGFDDAVVWNPGVEKCASLLDMPPEGYQKMLCVEAGNIEKPIQLGPSEKWTGMQSLTLL